jgi:outer membrane PBP1 activator LpoA protein
MRVASSVVIITLSASLLTACSKPESQTTELPQEVPQAATEMEKSAETVAPAAQEAQSLIDKAKSLIADNKYSEAMDVLKRLSSMELTAEQKKMVDDLMAQVQKAMAGAAASEASDKAKDAVGGMLGGDQ